MQAQAPAAGQVVPLAPHTSAWQHSASMAAQHPPGLQVDEAGARDVSLVISLVKEHVLQSSTGKVERGSTDQRTWSVRQCRQLGSNLAPQRSRRRQRCAIAGEQKHRRTAEKGAAAATDVAGMQPAAH